MNGQGIYHPLDCPICGNRMVFDCRFISCNHCRVSAPVEVQKPDIDLPLITMVKRTLLDGTVTLT